MRTFNTPYGKMAFGGSLAKVLAQMLGPQVDLHVAKAAELFGCQETDVTPEMRAVGKAANYFEGYGLGPVSTEMAIHTLGYIEGLAEDQVVPRAGVEPALLSEPHFECGASTNSANGATEHDVAEGIEGVKPVPSFELILPHSTQRYSTFADLMVGLKEHVFSESFDKDAKEDPEEKPEQINIWERNFPKDFPRNADHAFIARLRDLWQDIDLPNAWDLEFYFDTRGFYYLQIEDINGRCNVTGEAMPWSGRKWHISPHMKNGEIVQTVFKAVMTAVEHEAREQFMYKDQAIFDPHYDLETLVKVREAGNTEHRH